MPQTVKINGVPVDLDENLSTINIKDVSFLPPKNNHSFFLYRERNEWKAYVWQFIPTITGYDSISARYNTISTFGTTQDFYVFTGNENKKIDISTRFVALDNKQNYEWVLRQIRFLQGLAMPQFSRSNPSITMVKPPPLIRIFHGLRLVDIPCVIDSVTVDDIDNALLSDNQSLLPSVVDVKVSCTVFYPKEDAPGGLDFKSWLSDIPENNISLFNVDKLKTDINKLAYVRVDLSNKK